MKPSVIRVVDLGLSPSFAASVSFAQALIGSIDTEVERPSADVEFVRCRDWAAIVAALVAPTRILHILAHGHASPEAPGFESEDEEDFRPGRSRRSVRRAGIRDRCGPGLRGLLRQRPAALHPCREGLHPARCRLRGRQEGHQLAQIHSVRIEPVRRVPPQHMRRGVPPLDRAYAAAERARGADEQLVGRCPLKAVRIQPSRNARRAFSS